MATRIKRGTSAKRGATRAKPRTAQRSRTNAFLARLPFTEEQMQKAATIGILGILALGGVITAQFMGLPGMVQEEMALAAGRAGFEVKKVEVRNVDKMNELKVYEIVLAQKDRSMPQVDLEELRRELTRFSWIADARISRQLPDTLIVDIVDRENPTIRQLIRRLAGARGHRVVVGTPEHVANEIQSWFEQGAADGFNVMPPYLTGGFDNFVAEVVPILRKRGLFRQDYSGTTLRDHYGLPRPDSLYAAEQRKSA